MDCPKCSYINPDNALRCACGYDFSTKRVIPERWFSTTGRIGRKTYFYRVIPCYTVLWFLSFMVRSVENETTAISHILFWFGGICMLLGLSFIFIQSVKRMHDVDFSAIWLFVPGANFFFLMMMLIREGTQLPNKHGPSLIGLKFKKLFNILVL